MARTTTRPSGADTRAALREAAVVQFRLRGFEATTLDHIAHEVGVTRAAVLHYFGSKDNLLVEVVAPAMAAIDELLDEVEAAPVRDARQQRVFLRRFVDMVCDNRAVAALLTRDLSAQQHLGPELQLADRAARFTRLASLNHGPSGPITSLAALGAIVRPVAAPDALLDLDDPEARATLVNCALAALRAGS